MSKKRNNNFSTLLKKFLFTYKQALLLAWKARKDMLIWTLLLSVIDGAFVYPQLLITKNLVDNVILAIGNRGEQATLNNIYLFVGLEMLVLLIRRRLYYYNWVLNQMLSRFLNIEVEKNAVEKINKLPIAIAESPKVRDLYRKIYTNAGRNAWGLIMPISAIPYNIVSMISAGIALISVNPIFILIASVLSIPDIFLGVKNNKEAYIFDTKTAYLQRIGGSYEDFVSKGRYLFENKILMNTEYLVNKFWTIYSDIFSQRYKMWLRFGNRRFVASIPLGIVQAGMRGYFYFQAIFGKFSFGTAQMQIQAINEFISGLSEIGKHFQNIHESYLYIRDYSDFMTMENEDLENGIPVYSELESGIEFRDVWFKYPQNNKYTLSGVNFSVDPKENIAIVGKNGAGKTTIIKLLCRFYKPDKGEILFNGKNIYEYSLKDYRKAISALFQEFAQYPFSAGMNIGMGDYTNQNNKKRIKETATHAGINSFVEDLPKGYDNALDNEFEGGIEPSKGQWQRIALARALFRDAEIYILDEPTSNVDPEAEEEIFEKIITLAKNKIIFLVSHRFSTVRKADKILVLDDGKIQECGSHSELMKKKGIYASLFELQAKAYQTTENE